MFSRALATCMGCLLALSSQASIDPDTPKNVQLERSRVVIKDGQTKSSFGITNNQDAPVMINSWIENVHGQKDKTFLTSPPLFRLSPQVQGRIRIVQTKTLPQDRESVFYVVVKSLPASSETTNQNTLQIVLEQRFKLFYRPKGITEDCHDAADALQWSYSNKTLSVKNPSAVSVPLSYITIGKNNLDINEVVLPKGETHWDLKHPLKDTNIFSYSFIDELGGVHHKQVKLQKKSQN